MKERVKSTCGKYIYNSGTKTEINFIKYEIDYNRDFYLFDIIPMGAVRMTKSDTWKLNPNHADPKKRQRKSVTKYFEFKNNIKFQAEKMNIERVIPMLAKFHKKPIFLSGFLCSSNKLPRQREMLTKSHTALNTAY